MTFESFFKNVQEDKYGEWDRFCKINHEFDRLLKESTKKYPPPKVYTNDSNRP